MQIPVEQLRQCWFLAGPTAGGKTATSLELARLLNAEILSLDSMAIYRDMDIGTAKPSPAEQQAIPHHLLDLIDPHESFSTADYIQAAAHAIDDILKRGKVPLFVGGTGLYLRSILRGVFEGPAADWKLRRKLEAEEENEPGCLYQHLQRVDPASASKLHPNDQRRIIRAIEVWKLTGEPLSHLQQQFALPEKDRATHVYWLHPHRDWLYDRINRRVDLMMEQGLVEEVRKLLQKNPPAGRTALQGLGYKEIVDYLQHGVPLEEAIETLKTRTRQFAKRQHTWFRNLEECQEVPVDGTESPQELAARFVHYRD